MGYIRKRATGAYEMCPEPRRGGIAVKGVGAVRSIPGFRFAECDFSPGFTPREVYVGTHNPESGSHPFIFMVGEDVCTFVPWMTETCPEATAEALRRHSTTIFRELMAAFALAKFMLE